MDAITRVPPPRNEPVLTYAPGTPERTALQTRLAELAGERVELTGTIGGRQRMGSGEPFDVVAPHRHAAVLGTAANATHADAEEAVRCAKDAAGDWRALSFDDRAAVFLRRPTCWPGRGGRPSTRRRCSVRARRPTRRRSTARAS